MSELFSAAWSVQFRQAWNDDSLLVQKLQQANFSSTIAFGFENETHPRCILKIVAGEMQSCAVFNNQALDWDLRASDKQWQQWCAKPPGLMQLSMAYSSRKLRILKGDYAAMLKTPSLADAFVRSFNLLAVVSQPS